MAMVVFVSLVPGVRLFGLCAVEVDIRLYAVDTTIRQPLASGAVQLVQRWMWRVGLKRYGAALEKETSNLAGFEGAFVTLPPCTATN